MELPVEPPFQLRSARTPNAARDLFAAYAASLPVNLGLNWVSIGNFPPPPQTGEVPRIRRRFISSCVRPN
jgi:hypothetical protein